LGGRGAAIVDVRCQEVVGLRRGRTWARRADGQWACEGCAWVGDGSRCRRGWWVGFADPVARRLRHTPPRIVSIERVARALPLLGACASLPRDSAPHSEAARRRCEVTRPGAPAASGSGAIPRHVTGLEHWLGARSGGACDAAIGQIGFCVGLVACGGVGAREPGVIASVLTAVALVSAALGLHAVACLVRRLRLLLSRESSSGPPRAGGRRLRAGTTRLPEATGLAADTALVRRKVAIKCRGASVASAAYVHSRWMLCTRFLHGCAAPR
jgi:hypothetical protein